MWRRQCRATLQAALQHRNSNVGCFRLSNERSASSLASLVHRQAAVAADSVALAAPKQGVSWTYGELSQRAVRVSAALTHLGYSSGDVLATDLPNSAENLLLQVAASHLGLAVATVKDAAALAALGNVASVRGAVSHSAAATGVLTEAGLPLATVVVNELDGSLAAVTSAAPADVPIPAAVPADDSLALGYWSSTTPLTNGEALTQMGADAKSQLNMGPNDKVLVSITLCHAFGIASAVGSSLLAGATIVLPGASGIRGCGSPSQRAQVTLEVLEAQRCSLLFADVHTLKALPEAGSADLSALRGGACKVGSGADFLHDVTEAKLGKDGEMRPIEYAGVRLTAVGKKK